MKRRGAGKTSRHKKGYWRKGADVADVETEIESSQAANSHRDQLASQKNVDLFTIDKDKTAAVPKLTRRQRAALAKIAGKSQVEDAVRLDGIDVIKKSKRTFPSKKKIVPFLNKSAAKREARQNAMFDTNVVSYDLWNTDECKPKMVLRSDLAEYYLMQTKKKLPKEPKTLKHVPSILAKVEPPDPGLSYNPSYNDHQQLLAGTLRDEIKVQAAEQKMEKRIKLAPGQQFVTREERNIEESSGLFDEKKEELLEETIDSETTQNTEDVYRPEVAPVTTETRKTTSQRNKEKSRMEMAQSRRLKKELLKRNSAVFRMKKMQKEIKQELTKRTENVEKRAKKRRLDKLTKPCRLSKAKFQQKDEPVILTDDLVGSLRQMKPEGDLVAERMQSLQKRNILPVPNDRKRKPAKKRKLKVKITERRSHQAVVIGTKLL